MAAAAAVVRPARPVAIPTGLYEVNLDLFYRGIRHVGIRTVLTNVTTRADPPTPLVLPHEARIRVEDGTIERKPRMPYWGRINGIYLRVEADGSVTEVPLYFQEGAVMHHQIVKIPEDTGGSPSAVPPVRSNTGGSHDRSLRTRKAKKRMSRNGKRSRRGH